MEAALKAKWLKALRGQKYRQGRGNLKHRGAFCCLGVLADIQGVKWVNGRPYLKGVFVGHDSGPSSFLSAKFGINKRTQKTLANMNDGKGEHGTGAKSFKEIAGYIEQNL